MLSRWFNRSSRLTHPDRAKRLQAVQTLSAEQANAVQDQLLSLARDDTDAEVRAAALEHIRDADTLAQLLDADHCAQAAAEKIAAHAAAGETCVGHDHELVLQARIRLAQPDHVAALLPLLTSAEQCAELAVRVRDEAKRANLLTHPSLSNEQGLSVLQRVARGRDKNCHRHAKERLERIKTERQHCSAITQRLAELDSAITKALADEPAAPQALYAHRQKLLKLKDMRATTAAELTESAAQLAAAGADAEQFKVAADPFQDIEIHLPEPAADPFPPLVAEFEQLATDMRSGKPLDTIAERRDALTTQWLANADRYPPSAAQHQLFEDVSSQFQGYKKVWECWQRCNGWQEALPQALSDPYQLGEHTPAQLKAHQQWQKRWRKSLGALQWPANHTPPSETADALAAWSRIDSQIQLIKTSIKDAKQTLRQHIKQAESQLQEGQLEKAKQSLQAARRLHQAGVKGQERELAALSAQVAEFRDWQTFATNPKREDLLQQLQTLAEQPLQPDNQATRLKHLRGEWQQLGKPNSAAEFAQQRQFDEWAEQAFEPCRLHYAQQAEVRADNLAARQALCEQLHNYLTATDWDNADMQAAESILRSARQEWQQHHPCDRRALQPVQKRFEALQDELHNKVKATWEANVARKQAIVDEAKALLDAELSTQIEGAKALQQRWRSVGKTPRGPDQRLWREFRAVCDQIFAQREADHQQRKAAVEAQYQALDEAVSALENATQQPQPSKKELNQLSATIEQASVDLNVSPQSRKRIHSAQADYQKRLQAQARQQEQADLQQWREWDEQVSAAECTDAVASLEAPHPVFAARLRGTASPADWLQLVLEAEIAADLPSPEADQGTRMALQIDLMNAGRRDLAAEDHRELLRRWCEAGPKAADLQSLRERFFHALQQRL